MTTPPSPESSVLSPESSVLSPFLTVVTADGRGAIGVVRVWGPGALDVADRAFRPNLGRGLTASPVGRLRVGRVGAGLGDEVVAVIVDAGSDSPEVEIQCHGGPSAIGLVVEALVASGAKARSPRAWLKHSNGSSINTEAELALARASTAKVAEVLLDQVNGALDDELRRIQAGSTDEALAKLDSLIGRAEFGLRLVEGWRVVLAGRPNVGKSRLLNALAGFDRAIVDPTPGTTRDVVTIRAAFAGWPVELADTAGLRATSDPIESEGQALAKAHQLGADLVIVVLDRSEPLTEADRAILAEHPRAVVVANKADLPANWPERAIEALAISAETGDGVETLVEVVANRLVPRNWPAGSAVPFRPAMVRRLRAIEDCFRRGNHERAVRAIERWLGAR